MERVRALRREGLGNNAIAAILDIEDDDVVDIRLGQTFESGDPDAAQSIWMNVHHAAQPLDIVTGPNPNGGPGLDNTDGHIALTNAADGGITRFAPYSPPPMAINNDGNLALELPGLYLLMGYINMAASWGNPDPEDAENNPIVGFEQGTIFQLQARVDAADTFLPDAPQWALGQSTPVGADFSSGAWPFSGIVPLPESQDVGPVGLWINVGYPGWPDPEEIPLTAEVKLTVLKLEGTGQYSVT